jgi:hypothetical protein
MAEQPTTTENQQLATEERQGQALTENAEAPGPSKAPSGTRELRDAQRRPSIRAEGTPPTKTGVAPQAEPSTPPSGQAPLFDEGAGKELRDRWLVIQTEFVDEPQAAVEKADSLVAEVLQNLTDTFAREREQLEAGWSRHGDGKDSEISTEDLRQAIRRYRSFFNRLLAI